MAAAVATTVGVDLQSQAKTFVIRMKIGNFNRRAEKIACAPRESLQSVIATACSTFAHGRLNSPRGKEVSVEYEVLDGQPDRILRLIEEAEAIPRHYGLTVTLASSEASIVAAGAVTVRFDPEWLSKHGDEAQALRALLDEGEPELSVDPSVKVVDIDPSILLHPAHYKALLNGFAWWIGAADALLPLQRLSSRDDADGYIYPEHYLQRDKFIALEKAFWKDLPNGRRYAVWADGCDQAVKEGLGPSMRLMKRYCEYRTAVCEFAQEIVSPDLCEQLEERV